MPDTGTLYDILGAEPETAKPPPGPTYDRLPIVLALRGTPEWKATIGQWAAHLDVSEAELIDRALNCLRDKNPVLELRWPLPERLRPRRRYW